jgi:hypothetical protein
MKKKRSKPQNKNDVYLKADEAIVAKVLEKFYRIVLRENEDIIDNSDETIARELNIQVYIVRDIITSHLYHKAFKLRNKKYIW